MVPNNEYFDMPTLFDKILLQQLEATAFPIREYWLDIGRKDDLERANGDFAEIFT
jgi:NDP-sugar pyrophosphorylase family protein